MKLIICFHGEDTAKWEANSDNYENELFFMGFDFDSQSGESSTVQTNWKINRAAPHINFSKIFEWAALHGVNTLHFTDIAPN